MKHVKLETISIKNSPEINEAWVQTVIFEDPTILGLGDLIPRDIERRQPNAGRLDLLLQDAETDKRYEVEIQLGATDENHIIRTLEYWDLERKRYPQYEHCAVIIAEDVTSRFLNIISLFNGFIPLVAIQMKAIKNQDGVGLFFTKVIGEMSLGLVDVDEEVNIPATRDYWLKRGTKQTVELADELFAIVQTIAPGYKLKYNKYYIGLEKAGIVNNFVQFKPKKQFVKVESRMEQDEEISSELEAAGLEFEYFAKWNLYALRLREGDVEKNKEVIEKFIRKAFEINQG
jgi:predicted transcriptional regulator